MKWFTPVLPYLAVILGIFWFQNAWIGLLGFHIAIVLAVLLVGPPVPVSNLFKSSDIRRVFLSILLCGSSGISLYFLWPYVGVISDLPAGVESFGLTNSTWPVFVTYFALVNPLIEEYFWRVYLGSPTKSLHISDFLYAGFHALILWNRVRLSSIIYSLIMLVVAGWFWRQLAREDKGLLASVLGHMAADLTILLTLYRMSV